jgi:hypothetical protein
MSDYREYDDEPRKPRPAPKKGQKAPPAQSGGKGPSAPAAQPRGKNIPGNNRRQDGQERMLIQEVDVSELATQEALQREKYLAAREIEEGARDIKECFDEFSTLVSHQQQGLDNATKNVDSAVVNVQAGTTQLKQAQEHQKSSRKRLCCIIGILVLVIAAIVVVVIVLKK